MGGGGEKVLHPKSSENSKYLLPPPKHSSFIAHLTPSSHIYMHILLAFVVSYIFLSIFYHKASVIYHTPSWILFERTNGKLKNQSYTLPHGRDTHWLCKVIAAMSIEAH